MLIFAKTALSFAASHWKAVLIALAFAALGLKLAAAQSDARHWEKQSTRYEGLYKAEITAHAMTILEVRRKTAEAKVADATNVVRVITAQSKVNEEVSHDYQADLAAARRRAAERVRSQPGADPRGVGHSPDPAAGETAGRADGAAEPVGLSDAERLECTEIALRLHYLQEWELKQQAIPLDQPEKVAPPD
jgi:hypothetical protein